jgi:glyceraldehyde 3-phosphate dehydrogenase
VLRYSTDPIVFRDIVGDSASCLFDSPLTQALGRLVKVFGWYDNEWPWGQRLSIRRPVMVSGMTRTTTPVLCRIVPRPMVPAYV